MFTELQQYCYTLKNVDELTSLNLCAYLGKLIRPRALLFMVWLLRCYFHMTQQFVSIRTSWLGCAYVTEGAELYVLRRQMWCMEKVKKPLCPPCLNERSEWAVRKNTLMC